MKKIFFILAVFLIAGAVHYLTANGSGETRIESAPAYNDGEALPPPEWEGANWQKPTEHELMNRLSDIQYRVTQNEGTEPAFRNDFWNNHEEGLYVDIVSGEPLFSSNEKYDSGTGWPSFTRPLSEGNIVEISDSSLRMERTEVRSFYGDSHLGHVFSDGPAPNGLRYCINSASLKFIPLKKMKEKGYGDYLSLFRKELAIGGKLPDWRDMYAESETERAVFAGGCFWGVEAVFEQLKGVLDVDSGYAGGEADTAFYSSVGSGLTGHAESVEIIFDPKQIDYTTLLEVFFTVAHDPTQLNYQGPDRGTQYRSAVFYGSERQRRLTEEYIAELEFKSLYEEDIVTEVTPLKAFYPAEEYHQDFLRRNPSHPYISYWDIPKLEDLNNRFPELIARDRM